MGVEVHVEHVGTAVLGAAVRGLACVDVIDGRHVEFTVTAYHGDREIGRGTHRRAIVSLARLLENLAKESGDGGRAMTLVPNRGELPKLETLLVSMTDRIATVTLNRPRSLNAVNRLMTAELERVVEWLAGHPEDVRVVLLTGAGEAFCAGDDVIELPALSQAEARDLSLRQANLYLAFERLPQPMIAAVNGVALRRRMRGRNLLRSSAGLTCGSICDARDRPRLAAGLRHCATDGPSRQGPCAGTLPRGPADQRRAGARVGSR